MFERVRHMLLKEFHQLFRDPQMLRILILPPLLQILLFGYAVTTNVRNRMFACDAPQYSLQLPLNTDVVNEESGVNHR